MEKENLRSGQDANRGYSGVPTFLRSPYCEKIEDLDADYAILGVPYDEGSPFVGGSRFCAR
jgi:agmatinase